MKRKDPNEPMVVGRVNNGDDWDKLNARIKDAIRSKRTKRPGKV